MAQSASFDNQSLQNHTPFSSRRIIWFDRQLRRACSSIPTNIAEGCGRETVAELCRFLFIAMGSASETEYLFLLANDLDYLDNMQYSELFTAIVEIKKMLAGLIQKLK